LIANIHDKDIDNRTTILIDSDHYSVRKKWVNFGPATTSWACAFDPIENQLKIEIENQCDCVQATRRCLERNFNPQLVLSSQT